MVSRDINGALRLWNPAIPGDPGRELCHRGVLALAVASGDGRVLFGTDDGIVRVWGNPTRPTTPAAS